jgi:NADH-quinone oxidoreductase subunit H
VTQAAFDWTAVAVKMLLWIVLLLQVTPIMVWVERRAAAMMQDRPGPNRLGPLGLFQALADVVKFIFKETLIPAGADKPLYLLAPLLAIVPAMTTYIVLPLGPVVEIAGRSVNLIPSEGETGVLLFLAVSSLGVYSLILAGYSSNSKWSLMGAIRASAQLISYELALTLSVVAALLPAQSLRLDHVVQYQIDHVWNVIPMALGFFVFLIASFAETNRLPFDLPEAESELVAGYHTEYGGMRFALFFMGEYMAMAGLSALCATLFLGGWHLPFGLFDKLAAGLGWLIDGVWVFSDIAPATQLGLGKAAAGLAILGGKIGAFLFLFVWVRWTFPRFRYDQLMRLGWKILLPVAILNLLLVAVLTIAGWL